MKKWFSVRPMFALPCVINEFTIKKKSAVLKEFGHYEEGDKSECSDSNVAKWGCYKKHFVTLTYDQNQNVVKKYNLTEDEYKELTKYLETVFNIGTCKWCV